MEKEKKKKSKFFAVFFLLLLVVLCGFVWYFADIASLLDHRELNENDLGIEDEKNNADGNDNPGNETVVDDKEDNSIVNIALYGVDQRDNQTQVHSDAIIILTIDKSRNKIKMSSIMRDTAVDIEGYGKAKLTDAYFKGGPQLSVKTINQNFGLDITEYATVNFSQMAEIIDAVGGIELELTEAERLAANVSIKEQSVIAGLPEDYIQQAGLQHLNGAQAVAFARIRKVKTSEGSADDFGRTDRQREVLSKLFYKALDTNPIKYPEIARKLLPMIHTSLDIGEILDLAGILLRDVSLEQERFPLRSSLIGDGVLWINETTQALNVDLEKDKEALKKFIYDDIKPE